MAAFRIDQLGSLAKQLAFTPADKRAGMVCAAEALLISLEPAKAYPYAYIVFRITGYHPKAIAGETLLTGLALQHDLGLLIEQTSDGLALAAAGFAEPVLTIDDLTAHFNVTSKTIQRWRRRGLPARRFVFPDGKRRVGFRLGVVEMFLARHHEIADEQSNFSVVTPAERNLIVRQARRLAATGLTLDAITRRIGRRCLRSPMAIEHTLRKHDAEVGGRELRPGDFGDRDHGRGERGSSDLGGGGRESAGGDVGNGMTAGGLVVDAAGPGARWRDTGLQHGQACDGAVLPQIALAIGSGERARIARLFRRRGSLRHVARRVGRPVAEIYRVVLDERVAAVNRRKVKFVDDPLYHQVDAGAVVNAIVSQQEVIIEPAAELSRVPQDLPPYLRELYRTPLLSPARERALFLQFNYRKFCFAQARSRLDPAAAGRRDIEALERHLARATAVKNTIIQANLRLVVSVAKRHVRPSLPLMELVSEGNLSLMRAVESFDTHRGNRFSTYATLALMKGFARSVPAMAAAARSMPDPDELGRLTALGEHPGSDLANGDHVRHLLNRLTRLERQAVVRRFDLGDALRGSSVAGTDEFECLGRKKQREIEARAMEKLRVE